MKNYYSVFKRLVKIAPNRPQFILPKLFSLALIALLLSTIVAVILNHFFCFADFGQIGDFFNGIIGPFLSLITILLVYATYQVQKKELTATLEELRKTAESMQDQKKIMEMQQVTQQQIRCDSIMLKMVEAYLTNSSRRIEGFKIFLKKVVKEYMNKVNSNEEEFKRDPDKFIHGITKYFLGELRNNNEYNNYKRVVYILMSAFAAPYYSGIKDKEYLNHIRIYVNNQLFLLDEILLESIFMLNRDDLTKAFLDIQPIRHLPSDMSLETLIKEYLLKRL